MIAVTCSKGTTVGVFGLARSGLSSVRALKDGGAEVFAWDDKDGARASAAELGATVAPWQDWPWKRMASVILSPGVPLTHPEPHPVVTRAYDAGADVIGDVELFARSIRPDPAKKGTAPVVAITGTNGKSTTTA